MRGVTTVCVYECECECVRVRVHVQVCMHRPTCMLYVCGCPRYLEHGAKSKG